MRDMIMAYQLLHNNLDLDTSELFTFNPSITRVIISSYSDHSYFQESEHHFLPSEL